METFDTGLNQHLKSLENEPEEERDLTWEDLPHLTNEYKALKSLIEGNHFLEILPPESNQPDEIESWDIDGEFRITTDGSLYFIEFGKTCLGNLLAGQVKEILSSYGIKKIGHC